MARMTNFNLAYRLVLTYLADSGESVSAAGQDRIQKKVHEALDTLDAMAGGSFENAVTLSEHFPERLGGEDE